MLDNAIPRMSHKHVWLCGRCRLGSKKRVVFVQSLAFWILFHGDQPPTLPKPVLMFSPEKILFGSVLQGIERGKAVVTNVSTKPVEITSISKGCDCAEVRIARGKLLPGEQREITFHWDTRGRRGDNAISIGVFYTMENDPKERIATLMIEAAVTPDFEVSSKKLVFFSNRQEAHQFTLTTARDSPVEIKGVIIHHPAFSSKISSDGQSVVISFDPEKWTDDVRFIVAQVPTTSENEPVFRLPISIQLADSSDP